MIGTTRPNRKRTPPHNINYRANIRCKIFKTPDLIISVNSVGTMVEDFPPGSVGLVSDVLGPLLRPMTFFDDVGRMQTELVAFLISMERSSNIRERGLSNLQELCPHKAVVHPNFKHPQKSLRSGPWGVMWWA
ncbi:MAG: hypothetical protein CM15mP48_0020 [Candidatus Poseidoniales archaeon]|nr:MAG: hypothetical protein CM15mP48_0020 [Candidatus Poseidoniales archaeon]